VLEIGDTDDVLAGLAHREFGFGEELPGDAL
jgi:hypothetical protein